MNCLHVDIDTAVYLKPVLFIISEYFSYTIIFQWQLPVVRTLKLWHRLLYDSHALVLFIQKQAGLVILFDFSVFNSHINFIEQSHFGKQLSGAHLWNLVYIFSEHSYSSP